jgi:hypothetical protein
MLQIRGTDVKPKGRPAEGSGNGIEGASLRYTRIPHHKGSGLAMKFSRATSPSPSRATVGTQVDLENSSPFMSRRDGIPWGKGEVGRGMGEMGMHLDSIA